MSQVMVTLGRTEQDGQTVDWWIGEWPNHAATLHRGGRTEDALHVFAGCPDEWLAGIIGIWQLLGSIPDEDLSRFATHEIVTPGYGQPTYLKGI